MAKMIISTKNMSYETWLDLRKHAIGGSEAAAVVGASKYKSPLVVYMEKIGALPHQEAGEAAYWGNRLEDIVRDEFQKRINADREVEGKPGLKVQRRNAIFAHDEYDYMRANLDGLIKCPILGNGIFEAKTAGVFTADEWEGEDVPNAYYIQVNYYMAIMGLDFTYLAVLIGGQRFKYYLIHRDQELIDTLIPIIKNFWENHVMANIPPEIDGSDPTSVAIGTLYPNSVDYPDFELNIETENYCEVIQELKDEQKELKEKQKELENKIKFEMKDVETALAGKHKVIWKTAKNGQRRFTIKLNGGL